VTGQEKCQIHKELNVLKDHLPNVDASKEDHLKDIHANNVELMKFKINITQACVSHTCNALTTHTDFQEVLKLVENAENVKLVKLLTKRELGVSLLRNVHALNTEHQMAIHVENAPKAKLSMILTNVSSLSVIDGTTNMFYQSLLLLAVNAEHVLLHDSWSMTLEMVALQSHHHHWVAWIEDQRMAGTLNNAQRE
jgi:hypothetical protein